ncbi:hypothetical protein Mnod_2120 [Methylobacterium nodulans ORS 2060]|uniref:Uncharacterized protein n=1 Tax=Methylobacterium nodulans (strain LMG 21967 / CNCM I-2342 / ORS 2060) TaxID=460265 RepID=B8IUN7_METNO|nr:hypothetical protein Mnod_2120 [Methylobacterium nodulans ORS 2060]
METGTALMLRCWATSTQVGFQSGDQEAPERMEGDALAGHA